MSEKFDVDEFLKPQPRAEAAVSAEEKKSQDTFDVDAFLGTTGASVETTTPRIAETSNVVTDVLRNAPMAAFNAPTGINAQAVGEVLSPLKQAIPQTFRTYAAAPYKAGADLIVGSMGLPPPYASTEGVKGLYNAYQGAQESLSRASNLASQSELGPNPTTGNLRPESLPAYRQMQKAGGPEVAAKLTELYGTKTGGAGNNAVRAWLMGPEGQALRESTPEFAAAADEYLKYIPTRGQQVMKVVGPALRGAARVAGPVGMGLNLYDAGQITRETDLGNRLAQGQGQRAEQAFRNMAVPYGGPQLDAQQAQNVLQSGSARDIQYFGGTDSLREQMRKKAAARVTGPVAPGQI